LVFRDLEDKENIMIEPSTVRRLKAEVKRILPQIIRLRHSLHREPEIGFHEHKTRQKILKALKQASLSFRKPLAGTDIIAELRGKSPKIVLLRADIDALPIQETSMASYRSAIPGMMHACGHDGHAAILTGAALVLHRMRALLPFSVRFVFQPCEEGLGGGKILVDRGACKNARAAYALHAWSGTPAGCVSVKPGIMFAAGVHFTLTLKGKSCHGAQPLNGRNPIPPGAVMVNRLNELHKKINRRDGSILSVCSFRAGANSNIIPDSAVIQGTARYLEAKKDRAIQAAVRKIIRKAVAGTGVKAGLDWDRKDIIPVKNTKKAALKVEQLARACLPKGSFMKTPAPTMGMEDFAFYIPGREGAMFRLGQGTNWPKLHNSRFNFNDRTIAPGIMMLCLLALSE
jgi:amidohydrolase